MAWYPHTSYPQAIRTSQREQAVDIYCHAMPPNTRPNPPERLIVYVADSALIISADSDLSPAVRTSRLLNPTMFMAAAFPPKRYSAELRNLMPASFSIGLSKLTGAQLPRTVVDPISGRSFSRPSKWT